MIKKQLIQQVPTRWYMVLRVGLLIICIVVLLFGLQSVALWLPWSWSQGLAANATVWPLLQLLTIVVGIGLGIILWRRLNVKIGLAFIVIGAACIVPTIHMIVSHNRYAAQHAIRVEPGRLLHMTRTSVAPTNVTTYGHDNGHSLRLSDYQPHNQKQTAAPTIVYVHGGGWGGGSRNENSEFFAWLNQRGWRVLSIDYRVARAGYASWRDAPRDVVCAMSWVNTQASKQGIDTDRVVLMGDSAGGQLALRAAYGIVNNDVASSCGGQPVVPKSVVGIVPAIDFNELYDDPVRGATSRANVVQYLGGTPQQVPEAYSESTILTHVKADLPPTLIINAANDTLVSPRSGEALATALTASGNIVEQYTLPYAVHSYWINPGGAQSQIARQLILQFIE